MAAKTPDSGKATADAQAESGFPPLPLGKGPQLANQPRITRSRAGQGTSKDGPANEQDMDMRVRQIKTRSKTKNETRRAENRTKTSGKVKEREYEWYPD